MLFLNLKFHICTFKRDSKTQEIIKLGNLKQELHETHTGLLRQLKLATENCVPGSGAPRLADVFLAWRERLLLYGDYCSNLTNAQDTLKMLDARDSTFNKQLAVSIPLESSFDITISAY